MLSSIAPIALRAVRSSVTRRMWHDDNLQADLASAIWNGEIDKLLFGSTPLQVKDRCIAARFEHAGGTLLLKRHLWGGFGRTLRSVGRESSARTCARLGLQLAALGIPTPAPRACLEHRIGPWGTCSYLATDFVEGESLYRFIRFESHSEEFLRPIARQVARIWQHLVEAGISHNDMKPENFIVDEQHRVWLIDLEKVRIGEKTAKQRPRNVFDVKNFLHVRGWHRRLAARELFYEEFMKTPYRRWLEGVMAGGEHDPQLTVWLLVDDRSNQTALRRSIDSVRDIADEVRVLAAGADETYEEVTRIPLCPVASVDSMQRDSRTLPLHDRNQWTLVLQQNEVVTPVLAKNLQQRIADPGEMTALRIPIERQIFGESLTPHSGNRGRPVRLVRQPEIRISDDQGELNVDTSHAPAALLTGTIQRSVYSTVEEFIANLNDETSSMAALRHVRGERPNWIRAARRAVIEAAARLWGCDGIRNGIVGAEQALLHTVFKFVEEAKLRKLSIDFAAADELSTSEEAAADSILPLPMPMPRDYTKREAA